LDYFKTIEEEIRFGIIIFVEKYIKKCNGIRNNKIK
jgi:hypothetical protein